MLDVYQGCVNELAFDFRRIPVKERQFPWGQRE